MANHFINLKSLISGSTSSRTQTDGAEVCTFRYERDQQIDSRAFVRVANLVRRGKRQRKHFNSQQAVCEKTSADLWWPFYGTRK